IQGRFTSPDEFTGGPRELYNFAEGASANPTFYADIHDPQSLNKYQYALNNPLRYVDPDGHYPDGNKSLTDRIKQAAQTVATTAVETVNGIASAVVEDNGGPTSSLPQNSVGRGIGHALSIAQGVGEIIVGGTAAAGGGAEAVVASPTVVGSVPGAAVAAGVVAVVVVGW